MKALRYTVGALCALALAGCGGQQTGNVSGNVTYHGKPITFGIVTFEVAGASQNPVVNGEIREGKYTVTNVPVGTAKIGVLSIHPETKPGAQPSGSSPEDKGGAPVPKGPFIQIPQQFSRADQSGITCTVTAGNQTHDIDLK